MQVAFYYVQEICNLQMQIVFFRAKFKELVNGVIVEDMRIVHIHFSD